MSRRYYDVGPGWDPLDDRDELREQLRRDDLSTTGAEAAAERRADELRAQLADRSAASPWWAAEGSTCPACGHGPRWHDDPSGCTRMLDGWCDCPRVYLPGAVGPDDHVTK